MRNIIHNLIGLRWPRPLSIVRRQASLGIGRGADPAEDRNLPLALSSCLSYVNFS